MPLQDFLLDAIYVMGIIIIALFIIAEVIIHYKNESKDESVDEK